MDEEQTQLAREEFLVEALGCLYPIELIALAIIYGFLFYAYQNETISSLALLGYCGSSILIYIIALLIGRITDFSAGHSSSKIFIHFLTIASIIVGIVILVNYNKKHTKLVTDDFNTPQVDQWYFPTSTSGLAEFKDKLFRISINEPNTLMWARYNGETSIKDFDLTINCAPRQSNTFYGIVFRATDYEFFLFGLSNEEYFLLHRNSDNKWTKIAEPNFSSAIDLNNNKINLHVVGNHIQAYVNEKKLIDLNSYELPQSGLIGLAVGSVESQTMVEFDNIQLKIYNYDIQSTQPRINSKAIGYLAKGFP